MCSHCFRLDRVVDDPPAFPRDCGSMSHLFANLFSLWRRLRTTAEVRTEVPAIRRRWCLPILNLLSEVLLRGRRKKQRTDRKVACGLLSEVLGGHMVGGPREWFGEESCWCLC